MSWLLELFPVVGDIADDFLLGNDVDAVAFSFPFPFLRLLLVLFALSALLSAARFSFRSKISNSSLYPGHSRRALAHWLQVGLVSSHLSCRQYSLSLFFFSFLFFPPRIRKYTYFNSPRPAHLTPLGRLSTVNHCGQLSELNEVRDASKSSIR